MYPRLVNYIIKSNAKAVIQCFAVTHHVFDTLFKICCLACDVKYISLVESQLNGLGGYFAPMEECILFNARTALVNRTETRKHVKQHIMNTMTNNMAILKKSDYQINTAKWSIGAQKEGNNKSDKSNKWASSIEAIDDAINIGTKADLYLICLLYTSPSPRD